jgi:3-keto-L-gulonate-6-phosphate decarboxylase
VFEDYIRNNVVSWFNWAQKNQLGVERMEDLILVSGCTLVTSWAAVAFVGNNTKAEVSLEMRTPSNGEESFVWSNNQGPVVYHNSLDPVRSSGYV